MAERPFWKSMLINLIEGFDEEKFKELMKDKRYNFEAIFKKFFCYMIVLLPLLSIMSAFFLTYFVASIVFTFQGTIVGTQTYQSSIPCDALIGQWLLVFGCLGFVFIGLGVVGLFKDVKDLVQILQFLIVLVQVAWLLYGMNILTTQSSAGCTASQWNVFSILVNFMFFGLFALMTTAILSLLLLIPLLSGIVTDMGAQAVKEDGETEPFIDKKEEVALNIDSPETKTFFLLKLQI